MTVELNRNNTIARTVPRKINGEVIQYRLMPQLRMAVISWLRDSRPMVKRVAIKTASGAI